MAFSRNAAYSASEDMILVVWNGSRFYKVWLSNCWLNSDTSSISLCFPDRVFSLLKLRWSRPLVPLCCSRIVLLVPSSCLLVRLSRRGVDLFDLELSRMVYFAIDVMIAS